MKNCAALMLMLGAPLALSACGLTPLYQGGKSGAARAFLNQVAISPIEGKAGWLVRDALFQRIGRAEGTPRYRLDVRLDDQITGFGVRSDDSITRERRTLRARYTLVDTTSNAIVVDATAGSDAGIDVVSSEYATIAAENSALERLSSIIADQIVSKVALSTRQSK